MAQNLYLITTQFLGKDLDKKAILGYVVARSEEQVADHINEKYCHGEWFGYEEDGTDEIMAKRQNLIAHKGDFHTEYAGKFFDQKFGWEEVADVTGVPVLILQSLGIAKHLAA